MLINQRFDSENVQKLRKEKRNTSKLNTIGFGCFINFKFHLSIDQNDSRKIWSENKEILGIKNQTTSEQCQINRLITPNSWQPEC